MITVAAPTPDRDTGDPQPTAVPLGPPVPADDSGGFEVNRGDLLRHAADVDRFAARTDRVRTIAQTEGLGGSQAYGLLCSPLLIPALEIFSGNTEDLLTTLGDAGHGLADGLRACAGTYDSAEDAIHGQIEGIS